MKEASDFQTQLPQKWAALVVVVVVVVGKKKGSPE